MNGALLLVSQAIFYFCIMTLLLGLRRRIGIGVFVCALGVMHFLETYLAAVFFIELPFGLISPGSTVLFSGKLAMILLLYVIEDTETVRQPIYGLLIGNLLMVALVLLLRLHEPAADLSGRGPDLMLIDQMGLLMIWGTTLLFIDSLAIVLLYDALAQRWPGRCFLAMLLSLAAVLTFDQLAFFTGLHLMTGVPFPALIGGWVAKMAAALTFALMAAAYLRWVERPSADHPEAGTARLFGRLTYRHRYEALLSASRVDALTGAWNRQQLDTLGPARLARAVSLGQPLGLAIVDLDHFKQVNDTLGHQSGDEALKRAVAAMKASIRPGDEVFRFGGDEFVILARGLRPADAAAYADRLRQAVAAEGAAMPVPLTVSIGIAVFPRDAGTFPELMRRADQRLYDAKGLGRNQAISD